MYELEADARAALGQPEEDPAWQSPERTAPPPAPELRSQLYRPCLFQREMPTLFRRQQDRVSAFNTLLPEGNWAHGCLEASLDEGLTGSQAEQMFSD